MKPIAKAQEKKTNIAILGSTGSIGTQTVEVIRRHSDIFCVEVLTADSSADMLITQALEFEPNAVVIGESKYEYVKNALSATNIKVFTGENAICDVVTFDTVDTVVVALMGSIGLKPTLKAIECGKQVALANKETLVMGGDLVSRAVAKYGKPVYPIDSEHSAIFQCMQGEVYSSVESIILTGSGGPFRGKKRDELKKVTPEQALAHPTWRMGRKISIDSATLMNKGLELIEACHLFGVRSADVEVVIHPQSIVHSLVGFKDGSVKAQLALPDMKGPILYALAYPKRIAETFEQTPRLSLSQIGKLEFEKPDRENFPCLALAEEAIRRGGGLPCVLNAANEIAVAAFLNGSVRFLDIPVFIEKQLEQAYKDNIEKRGQTWEDLHAIDAHVRLNTQITIEKGLYI